MYDYLPSFDVRSFDVVLGSLTIALLVHFVRRKKNQEELPLPPGPRRLPLIHNLLDLPKGFEPPHWAKHKELYGPISSISVLGTTYIIVNDAQVCFELLDKRSAIYSNRPIFHYGGELVGLKGATTLRQYGTDLRVHRKEMARCIGSSESMKKFIELEEVETRRLLLRVLDEPENLIEHIRTTTGAIILSISHGYSVNPYGRDPLVDIANSVLDIFSRTLVPGASIIDIFPILGKLPEWVPGTTFHKTAKAYSVPIHALLEKPFDFVKRQMSRGVARPSFAGDLIERKPTDEENMKWIAATLYGGGADTTVHAITTFFLAMVIRPEVLVRAQEELDRVIGRDRLPGILDRPQLPYIEAVVKETLRWNNVVPMGVPHALAQDDEYMGYKLPKDALVLPNIWLMTHDPAVYPDPNTFTPERFLGPNPQPDPRQFVFGFGRRICPGKELADSSVYIAIALAAAAFNIGRARDADGREIVPVNECSPGIISHPLPFKYSLTPRDDRAVALIRAVVEEHPFESGDAELLESL